jgi:polyhydroxybutyrate depolymerase
VRCFRNGLTGALHPRDIPFIEPADDPRMRRLLVVLAACGGIAMLLGAAHVRAASAFTPGTHDVSLRFDHRARSYRVFIPRVARGAQPLPVVINLHGGGSNAAQEERFSQMDALAEKKGFIVVYPNGTGIFRRFLLTWNAGTCCGYAQKHGIDDVGFILAVLDDVERRAAVDHRRVSATGMSNGAMMAYRLGAEAADRIAAIAPVSGGMVVTSFHPSRPLPVMHFHSVDDPRALFAGGLGAPFPGTDNRVLHPSIEAVIARWARFDGCPAAPRAGPTVARDGQTATRIAFTPCRAGSEVVLWKLTGSGHVWPGGQQDVPERLLGRPTKVIDANALMWQFFVAHPLPA